MPMSLSCLQAKPIWRFDFPSRPCHVMFVLNNSIITWGIIMSVMFACFLSLLPIRRLIILRCFIEPHAFLDGFDISDMSSIAT